MRPALDDQAPLAQPEGRPPLPWKGPWLLAPMEGVTDPAFRDVVAARHPGRELGGLYTDFLRISEGVPAKRVIRRHLGPWVAGVPTGLQLMGSVPERLAATAARAVEAGVQLVDLNCGCPAKGALRGCAGAALLDEPERIARLTAALVRAVPDIPVTVKIRSGGEDASRLHELVDAVESSGASMLTLHYRTKTEAYCDAVYWERIASAVERSGIPVCGNGSIAAHADFERMRRETGCAYAMVGRGALRDPWIFSGVRVGRAAAARFLLDYACLLRGVGAGTARGVQARLKQLLRVWEAGDLVGEERAAWLSEPDPRATLRRLRALAELEGPSWAPPPHAPEGGRPILELLA